MLGSAAFRTGVAPGGALAGPWVRNPLWTAARAVPSLDLRFADSKSLVDATTGSNLVTFTRASSGTFVGSDGLIKSAVTNLSLRSQELGDAAWTKTLSSITADATIAPNGTTTADKLVEDSSTGTHNIVEAATITYTSGLAYTFSFFIKKAERQTVQILTHPNPFPGTLAQRTAIFNSNTGAFVSVGSAYTGSSVTVFSDGWYRVSVSTTSDATATGNFSIALCSDDIGTSSYTGNGTSGLFLWGAQLEQSSTVGEYIPTTSTINSAPRFDHNPTTGESLGLLVEEQRTNLLLQSEAWNTSPWTSAAPYSVTVDDIVSPDGAQTADALILASGQSSFNSNVTRQVITKAASAIQYTRSVYFKALGLTTSVRFSDFSTSATNSATAIVSLIDGSIVTAPSVAGSFSGASVVVSNAGNGWWRVAFTYTTDATTSLTIRSFPYVGASQLTGDGTSGLYVWGAQLEAGAFSTSYIPTTTATVTRSADVASISGSNFSSWYRQDEGTVFADNTNYGVSNTRIASFSDNSTSNRFAVARGTGSGGNINTTVTVGGVAQVSSLVLASSLSFGLAAKAAVAVKASDFAGSLNGLTPVTQATGSMPTTLSQLTIGNGEVLGTNTFSGTIRRLVYWGQRLPNSTLQSITQ